MAIVHQPKHASAIDEHLGRHSPQLEQIDLLSVEIEDRMIGVGQTDERPVLFGPIGPKSRRILRTDHDDHAIVLKELEIILAQLRQVLAAEGSEKTTIKDGQDMVPVMEITERHHGAVVIGESEKRCSGIANEWGHGQISGGVLFDRQKTALSQGRFQVGKRSNRVFPPPFGCKKGMIGIAEQINQGAGILGIGGHSATDRQVERQSLRSQEDMVGNGGADLLGEQHTLGAIIAGEHQDEFITAVTDTIAPLGEKGADNPGQLSDRSAAIEMSVGIDHKLKCLSINKLLVFFCATS